MPVQVQGPDGKTYQFPDGTDKAAAIRYFKAKGIGAQLAGPAPAIHGPDRGSLRAPTESEELETVYPVGARGETATENIRNTARDFFTGAHGVIYHPIKFAEGLVRGFLPAPLEKSLTGQVTENPLRAAYEGFNTRPGDTAALMAGQAAAIEPVAAIARGAVRAVAPRVIEAGRRSIQGALGIGPRLTEEAATKAAKDFTKKSTTIEESNAAKMAEARQKQSIAQAKADADNRAEGLRLKQAYDQKVRDANAKFSGDKLKTEAANAQALREYNQAIGKVIQKNRAIEALRQSSRETHGRLQVVGSQLIDRVKRLSDRLRQTANEKYATVRSKMAGASLPSDVLADEVKAAQKQWIRGSPEKVREFNAMLSTRKAASPELTLADQTAQNMGYENFAEAVQNPQMAETLKRALPPDVWEAAAGEASKPISWNDLQGFYEETGGKLYGGAGSLPGDVYKALQQVHDFIGNQMQQLANARGVGSQFREARSFYRDYMQTFHEPTGPSGSGSPVAQVLDAKDPARAVDYFAGKSGERGVAMLQKYDPELANLAQEARRTAERGKLPAPRSEKKSIADIPKPHAAAIPQGSNQPLPPVLPEAERIPFKEPKQAARPPVPTLDPAELKRARLALKYSPLKGLSEGDLYFLTSSPIAFALDSLFGKGPGTLEALGPAIVAARHLFRKAVNSSAVTEWLAKPTAGDMRALGKLPPESQAAVAQQLRQFMASQPHGLPVSPVVTRFLQGALLSRGGQPGPRKESQSSPMQIPPPQAATESFQNPTDAWSNPNQ